MANAFASGLLWLYCGSSFNRVIRMRLFIPYPNFAVSAAVMTDELLHTQPRQALTIFNVVHLNKDSANMKDDQFVRWYNATAALALYMSVMLREIERRGGAPNQVTPYRQDGTADGAFHAYQSLPGHASQINFPPWIGEEAFHEGERMDMLDVFSVRSEYRQLFHIVDDPDERARVIQ